MQKISPLRSSIEAFNKFKASRKISQSETNENKANTNPFGITFKGTIIQGDVFEKTGAKKENVKSSMDLVNEKIQNTQKLLASAWVGTINRFSKLKTNVISFGNKLKDETVTAAKKAYAFASAPIDFNIFRYNVSRLQTLSVDELGAMLSCELEGVSNA